MKKLVSTQLAGLAVASLPLLSVAQQLEAPAPLGKPASTVYRQVMPDGRIVYSDKVAKGARLDETISVDPPIKGNLWTTDTGNRPPVIKPQPERTPVVKVPSIPVPGKRRTLDDATADVIRAEMYLEDAKKRREAGVEPLPGERTGNAGGGSRLNDAYQARQALLAREVAEAEDVLKKAIEARNALRSAR